MPPAHRSSSGARQRRWDYRTHYSNRVCLAKDSTPQPGRSVQASLGKVPDPRNSDSAQGSEPLLAQQGRGSSREERVPGACRTSFLWPHLKPNPRPQLAASGVEEKRGGGRRALPARYSRTCAVDVKRWSATCQRAWIATLEDSFAMTGERSRSSLACLFPAPSQPHGE